MPTTLSATDKSAAAAPPRRPADHPPGLSASATPAQRTRQRRSHAERSALTQAQLIDATMDVVLSRSFAGASLFEVAKQAGVTPGALQHHFGSKAELMLRTVERILEQSIGPDGDPDASALTPAHPIADTLNAAATAPRWPKPQMPLPQRIHQLISTLWQRIYEPPRFLAAWGIYFGSCHEPDVLPRLTALRQQLAGFLRQQILTVLPELASQPHAHSTVDALLAGLRGLAIARLFDPQQARPDAALSEFAELLRLRSSGA